MQRYNNYFKITIPTIAKNSTDFKTKTPKCAISVSHDFLFLRLTLKTGYCSAICTLQLSTVSSPPLEDGELSSSGTRFSLSRDKRCYVQTGWQCYHFGALGHVRVSMHDITMSIVDGQCRAYQLG